MTSPKSKTEDPETDRIVSIKDLAARVGELADLVKGGGKSPDVSRESSEKTPVGSVDEQVRKAIADAKEEEATQTAKEKERQAVEDRIKSLEEKTEKRPQSRSKLSVFMWGKDD